MNVYLTDSQLRIVGKVSEIRDQLARMAEHPLTKQLTLRQYLRTLQVGARRPSGRR